MQIRAGEAMDGAFVEEMLFEAFFWNDGVARPPLSRFREQPEFTKMFAGWGRPGDRALVATAHEGERLGAGWFRLWTPEVHSYGFVKADVPELGIGVVAAHRSKGVGRALLRALIATARTDGCPALSLSVSPENRARRLYESEGFRKVGESGTSWTLLCSLGPETRRAV
jgi:ribosomal protein S18 acetylase RimI-like enzyme